VFFADLNQTTTIEVFRSEANHFGDQVQRASAYFFIRLDFGIVYWCVISSHFMFDFKPSLVCSCEFLIARVTCWTCDSFFIFVIWHWISVIAYILVFSLSLHNLCIITSQVVCMHIGWLHRFHCSPISCNRVLCICAFVCIYI